MRPTANLAICFTHGVASPREDIDVPQIGFEALDPILKHVVSGLEPEA